MIGRTPNSSAARVNRAEPYSPPRSHTATAASPRSAAVWASSSGGVAPRRKLNARGRVEFDVARSWLPADGRVQS